jgi:hypothetical protein
MTSLILHGFFKYENDHQHGLNLHCILFFDGKGKLSTKAKIEQLKEKLYEISLKQA